MTHRRVVWITGGSSGIGAAVARELARQGQIVAVTARSADRLGELAARHESIHAYPADVTDRDAMEATARSIEADHGPIDIALLNAGTYSPLPVDDLTADVVRSHIDVNIMGVVHGIEAVLPGMRARREGTIALMSSVTALVGFPLAAAYGSTKAYIANMGESLRADLSGSGVTISVVFPGFVETELTGKNRFRMPLIITADRAAEIIAPRLLQGHPEIAVPVKPFLLARGFAALPGVLRRRALRRLARRRRQDSH